MDLIVDVPKHGSGKSNNGKIAQSCFQDPELTLSILVHGFKFIKIASLPISQLTEEVHDAINNLIQISRE